MQALPIIALGLGAIGTGVSVYGQQQAAEQQAVFARLNAQAQMTQAQQQADLAVAQAGLQAQQSLNQQQAGKVNADALRNEAEMRTRAMQINLARQQEDQKRFRSMLLNRGSKSGTVVGTGSQLDLIVEAAELAALENSEAAYQNELQRTKLFREAQAAEIGAKYSSIQAGLDTLEGQAAASAYRARGVQAQISGIAGVQSARAAGLGALGGAFQGFGNLGLKAWELNRLGAFRFGNS